MIVIEGTVRIPAARQEEARPVMEQMIRASRAEAGCLEALGQPRGAGGAFQDGAYGDMAILFPATWHYGPVIAPL